MRVGKIRKSIDAPFVKIGLATRNIQVKPRPTWHEILDDIHVREGVNFGRFGSAGVDSAEAG